MLSRRQGTGFYPLAVTWLLGRLEQLQEVHYTGME